MLTNLKKNKKIKKKIKAYMYSAGLTITVENIST